MTVWSLNTISNSTSFYFPLEEDKIFFHELVRDYFEKSKEVSEKWRPLYLLREEPMKHSDFFEIDGTDIIALSQKAADSLIDFLNVAELLPIETDAGKYYALNVINFVDCLNKEASAFIATHTGIIVNYSLLEFDEVKMKGATIFRIPEMPYRVFFSGDFQERCEEEMLVGLDFDPRSNLVWYPD